jgi:hypothetical protein
MAGGKLREWRGVKPVAAPTGGFSFVVIYPWPTASRSLTHTASALWRVAP